MHPMSASTQYIIHDWAAGFAVPKSDVFADPRVLSILRSRNLMVTLSTASHDHLLWQLRTTLLTYDMILAVSSNKQALIDFAMQQGVPVVEHPLIDQKLSPDFLEDDPDLPGELSDDDSDLPADWDFDEDELDDEDDPPSFKPSDWDDDE